MADFCAPCTVETFEVPEGLNDFVGWLTDSDLEWAWALCEGCGMHLFNNAGKRHCDGTSPPGQAHCSACEANAALAGEPDD